MRATVVLRRQRSPTRTAIKGETRRDLLWQGRLVLFLHAHLAIKARVRAWRCLGSVVSGEARAQTHKNRLSVPKNIMKSSGQIVAFKTSSTQKTQQILETHHPERLDSYGQVKQIGMEMGEQRVGKIRHQNIRLQKLTELTS